jgi:tight adherence protein B
MSIFAIIIGVCLFLSVLIFSVIGYTQLLNAASKYEKNFKQTAEINLTEMFVFIEPEKLYVANIIIIISTFAVLWLITEAWPVAIMVAVLLGFTPKFLWVILKNKRLDRFLSELPDALNSLSAMMKAGTNLNMALETVVAETSGPIGQEFGLFLRELRVGVDYYEALDNMKARVPLEELALVIAGMKISREIGGSLADVLGRLSDTIRRKIEMEGKIKSLTAQGKMQGYVMTGLPVFLAYILYQIEPNAMARLFTDPIGWVTCGVFIVFEVIGYYFIRKIVNIDV